MKVHLKGLVDFDVALLRGEDQRAAAGAEVHLDRAAVVGQERSPVGLRCVLSVEEDLI